MAMIKFVTLLISCLFVLSTFAQTSKRTSDATNSCLGAINIFDNDDYQLQFTGKSSSTNLEAYPSLAEISFDNQLWCSFIAPETGELNFTASKKEGYIQMIVFGEERGDMCGEINAGKAEIKRFHIKKNQHSVGLNTQTGNGFLYSLKLYKGEKVHVLFATEKKNTDKLDLNWNFVHDAPVIAETKIVDKRDDDFAPTLSIKIRDVATNKPLVANISILESKDFDALYVASDVFISVQRGCKINIKCDTEGYFFKDIIEYPVSPYEDTELVIELEKISSGKSIEIERIEFTPGTSKLVSSSEPKLRRLKDFLALNSDVKIEIQGHVFSRGPNSLAGQRVSEARAKRIMKYLVDNGISRSRLKAVGYGNTRPIYPEPKFSYEEQANRRVEVLVL